MAAADAGHPDRTHRARPAHRRTASPDARAPCHRLRHADGLRRAAGVALPSGGRTAAAALSGGAARRIPGHRSRPTGGAVGVVRRGSRRRLGPDRRRRPDPVDLRVARGVGDQPAPVHHRFPAVGRVTRADPRTAHQLAQPARSAAPGQRGVPGCAPPFGRGAVTAAAPRRRSRHCACSAVVRHRRRARVAGRRNGPAAPRRRRRHRYRTHGRRAGAPQRRRRTHGRGPEQAGVGRRGGRPGRAVGDTRGRRRGRDAAAGRRPGGRSGRDAGARRAPVAVGCPRHRRTVAPGPRARPRRRTATWGRTGGHRRATEYRRRRGLPR